METCHKLWDEDYWQNFADPDEFMCGHYFTYPLDKHREYFSLPEDNYGDYGWIYAKIFVDEDLDVYYEGEKFINLRQLARYYEPWKISCKKCKCIVLEHDKDCRCSCIEDDPDEQAQDHFYFNVTNGLYFADDCDYELFKSSRYHTISIYPGELKIGNITFSDAAVHITIPYRSLDLPFISNSEPLTKNIDYLMRGVYNRQLYTVILCFKQHGDLPLPFLESLLDYIN